MYMLIFFFLAGVDGRRQFSMEEEDDLLQFAIQQSLIDAGTEKEEVLYIFSNRSSLMWSLRFFLFF